MKYALIKQRYNQYDSGVICLFKNTKQRERKELTAMKDYCQRWNWQKLDYFDVEFTELPAKEAYKMLKNNYEAVDYSRSYTLNSSVKTWYTTAFRCDDLGYELPDNLTFEDVFNCLDRRKSIYKLLSPAADSVIRERVFQKLASIMHVDYDYIYEQWLKCA